MCEWLSREQWCDVRLLCGGRALGAHRAVLASRLLLSCPIEETPTLIVLPDFDLEAMSAVLYYIYNGEVTLAKQKLEKFLDIIKAMQIYIDRQYLTQFCINIGDIDYNSSESIKDDRIFILRAENDDKPLVTLKKIFQHDTLQSYKKDVKDYADFMQAPAQNWNEQFKPSLVNLQSSHRDRQRDYFLRDSFMETYTRNRNANGRAAGVPAKPNGCYRASTSLLLTNANTNGYLNPDNAFSVTTEKTVDSANRPPCSSKSACHLHIPYQSNIILTELHRKLSPGKLNVWARQQSTAPAYTFDIFENSKEETCTSYLDLSVIQKSSNSSISTFRNNENQIMNSLPWFYSAQNNYNNTNETIDKKFYPVGSRSKVAILNKALDNPWCPRLPNSFRPFRRKYHNVNILPDRHDINNNIFPKKATLNVDQDRSQNLTHLHNNFNVAGTLDGDDKKHANNQVLPGKELVSSRAGRYACSECGKTFSQLRNFKYHMSVHRGTKEFAASCAVCGKCFNDRGYLSSHMKIHRNRKEYKCSQCPKSFNQRVAYNMHVRIHTGLKPHVCPQCGKAFSRKMLLKQHQRTHSGERPYACPHCDKRFADRSNMTLHLRLHTGIKPFKCPMCPKSFTKKHHLKSHVNFHTGAKPYSCPRCKLAFTQSSNMRTHLKRCTAPEPAEDLQTAQPNL